MHDPEVSVVLGGHLIGRERELADVMHRAQSNRIVSIVGPGGVGKTALARVAASELTPSFPFGVRHVDLTRVDDASVVPGTVAGQLGFDSFDALLTAPNDSPALLVVDNCDHLLDAAATSIAQILGAGRVLTVIATSRSPLDLPGESVVSLAPLSVDGSDESLGDAPAVRLFLQRCHDAGATDSAFDLAQVVDVCRSLDGLPLALEIAAARARTMSIAEIAERVASGVDVLDRPRFRGDPRHRSLAETIAWSADLLSPRDRFVFEHLSVFSGPFTLVSARALAAEPLGLSDEQLDAIVEELAHASLLRVDTVQSTTRYRYLQTVRVFALEQLRRHGELEAVSNRLVDHVLATLRTLFVGTEVSWRATLLRELLAVYDDVAEALRWCIAHDDSPFRAHLLCSALWTIVHQGRADDIANLARRTIERWPDISASPFGAQAIACLATAEYATGKPAVALRLAQDALAHPATQGLATITLRRVLGQAHAALGERAASIDAFTAGARIGHSLGMPAMALELETAAAQIVADQGDVERGIAEMRSVLERGETSGSAITASWARTSLGWLLLRVDPPAASQVIEAALAESRRIAYPIAVAVNLRSQAYAQTLQGDLSGAVASATELLNELVRAGSLSNIRLLVDITAVLTHRCGHVSWAALVSTARSLPITSLTASLYELVPLPHVDIMPISRYDVVATVRHVLSELAATTSDAPSPDATSAPGSTSNAANATNATISMISMISMSGDVCEFRFAGVSCSVRASKGVIDIVKLIAADGREMHSLDLAESAVDQGSTGEVIDATARRAYEARIRDLQENIDEAEHNNDFARAYRYQIELDELIEHLTAALGRGGRTRRTTGNAERARSAVTQRIRTTIRHLERLSPALGSHLRHSIKTGAYCSYSPEQPTPWVITGL